MNFRQTLFSLLVSSLLSSVLASRTTFEGEAPVALESYECEPEIQITKVTTVTRATRPKATRPLSKPAPVYITLDSDSDEENSKATEQVMEVEEKTAEDFGAVPSFMEAMAEVNEIFQGPSSVECPVPEPLQARQEIFVPEESMTIAFTEPAVVDEPPSTPPAPSFDLAFEDSYLPAFAQIVSSNEQPTEPQSKSVRFNMDDSLVINIPALTRTIKHPRKTRFGLENFIVATAEHIHALPDHENIHDLSSCLKRKASETPLEEEPAEKKFALYGGPIGRDPKNQFRLKQCRILQNEVFIPSGQTWDVFQHCMKPDSSRIVLFNLDAQVALTDIVETLSDARLGLVVASDVPMEKQKKNLRKYIQLVRDMNGHSLPFAFVFLNSPELANNLIKALVETEAILKLGAHAGVKRAPRDFDRTAHPIPVAMPKPIQELRFEVPLFEEKQHQNPSPASLKPSDQRVVLFNLDPQVTLSEIVNVLSDRRLGLIATGPNTRSLATQKDLLRKNNVQLFKDENGAYRPYAFVHLNSPEQAKNFIATVVQKQILLGLGEDTGIDIAPQDFDLSVRCVQISFKDALQQEKFSHLFTKNYWLQEKLNMPVAMVAYDEASTAATIVFQFERHAKRASEILRTANHEVKYPTTL